MKVPIVILKLWQKIKQLAVKQVKADQKNSDIVEAKKPFVESISEFLAPPDKGSTIKQASKDPKKIKNNAAKAALNANERALFERLKSLRLEFAHKIEKPAFVVFSDATLLDMIAKMPATETEMLSVNGVGKEKLARFGGTFLDLIANREAALNPNEQVLFERLKSLRLEFAHKIEKPAFVVFSDATLLDMIAKMPTNEAEMLGVNGVGKEKFARYGEAFLDLIASRANDSEFELECPDVLEGVAHYDYLISSLESSQRRLVIMSGWITSYVVDDVFLKLVEKKLKQEVKIYIGYGYQDNRGNHKEIGGSKDALVSLQKLMKTYPAQLFIAKFATHEKLLLVDSHCVLIGSANWLCNKDYINSERSLIVDHSRFVNSEATRAIKLIEQSLITKHGA